jgi:hypothetical protein
MVTIPQVIACNRDARSSKQNHLPGKSANVFKGQDMQDGNIPLAALMQTHKTEIEPVLCHASILLHPAFARLSCGNQTASQRSSPS